MYISKICTLQQQKQQVKMMSIVCPLSTAKDHLSATRQVALISYKRKRIGKKNQKMNSKKVIWGGNGIEERGHTLNQERFMLEKEERKAMVGLFIELVNKINKCTF